MKYAVTKNIFKLAASEKINNVFSIVLEKITSWGKTLAEAPRLFSRRTFYRRTIFTQSNYVRHFLDE